MSEDKNIDTKRMILQAIMDCNFSDDEKIEMIQYMGIRLAKDE